MHFFHLKWHISDIASNRSEILFNILTFNGLISFLPQIFKKKEQWKLQNIRKKKICTMETIFSPKVLFVFKLVLGFWSEKQQCLFPRFFTIIRLYTGN